MLHQNVGRGCLMTLYLKKTYMSAETNMLRKNKLIHHKSPEDHLFHSFMGPFSDFMDLFVGNWQENQLKRLRAILWTFVCFIFKIFLFVCVAPTGILRKVQGLVHVWKTGWIKDVFCILLCFKQGVLCPHFMDFKPTHRSDDLLCRR